MGARAHRPGCVRRPRKSKRVLGSLDIAPFQEFANALTDIHLPVLSDAGVSFLGEHMSEGTLFELNNGKSHAVKNPSEHHRVHLIFDMYPQCEVAQTSGPLVQ